jgi:hypothetical protein
VTVYEICPIIVYGLVYGPFDRRRRRRYPVVLALRWHLVRGSLSGTGSTLDMTSRALAY